MGILDRRTHRLEREAAKREPTEDRITAIERRIISPNGELVDVIRRDVQWRQTT
jgi:hypothetical protein